MRVVGFYNKVTSVAGALLLCLTWLAPVNTQAATAIVEPSTQFAGLPEAGAPSFIFGQGADSFSGNIQSWYENYAVFQNVGGADGSYNFFAHNEGSFTYWETLGTNYSGANGSLDLQASFDSNGMLQAGGTISITGTIAGIGITDPTTILMTAEITDFAIQGNKIGFAINNIECADEIVGCATTAGQTESVYFGLGGNFKGIKQLNGSHYRSTIMSATTVPVPAAAWLMLSALGALCMFKPGKRTAS